MLRERLTRPETRRELIIGSLLLVFAVAWTVTVYLTVPHGRGASVGPRAFPLFLGGLLILLSVIMLLQGWRNVTPEAEPAGDGEAEPATAPIPLWPELRIIGSVALIIAAYGWLMQNAGFVLATLIVVSFTLWVVVGVRRVLLVAGMAVGITAGSWLAFGQLLGAYMPRGTWINFLF